MAITSLGLIPLLDRYRVGQVLDVPQSDTAPEAAPWLEGLATLGVPRTLAQRGMRLPIGDLGVTVLHPGPVQLAGTASDDNNNAIVLRLDYGQTSFILTGDAESEAEDDMIAAGLPLRADVLKVGHHGSNGASSSEFIAAVAPRLAVIPVGVGEQVRPSAPGGAGAAGWRRSAADRSEWADRSGQ